MIKRIKTYFSDISRNVRVLSLGSFLNDASTEMIYPLLPLFLTKVLGASVGFVGVIEGLAESTASFAKLLSGWYSDKVGKRKGMTVLGYSISGLTRPLIAMAVAPWHILAARFLDRIGKGVRVSPRDALLAGAVNPQNRAKAFGFHRAMDNAGALLGPSLAMLILWWKPNDYRFLFWMAVIPTFLAVFVLASGIEEKTPAPKGKSKKPPLKWSSLDSNFKKYLFVMVVFTLGNSSDAFLLLRAEALGVASYQLPLIWMVLHVVKTLTNMPGGSIADKYGKRKTIVAGWFFYAIIYGGFALASTSTHVWALFGLYGIYFGLTEGAEKALVGDMAPEEVRGTAYGFFNMAIGVAAFPSSVLFGYVWKTLGVEFAFGMGAAFALLASLLMAAMVKTVEVKP